MAIILPFVSRQWGVSPSSNSSPVTFSLPVSYALKQFIAIAEGTGAGITYGTGNLGTNSLSVYASIAPFSAFWISAGK